MKMFNHSNSTWVRYSEYEWKQDENGKLYLTACADAQPAIYDPLKEYTIRNKRLCGKVWAVRIDDGAADHTFFYGL